MRPSEGATIDRGDKAQPSAAVLVVGESIIDQIVDGERRVEVVGGSPLNVAVGLGRCHIPVRLHSAIAQDARGQKIVRHLQEASVAMDDSALSASRTSTARVDVLDAQPGYTFALDFAGGPIRHGSEEIIHFGSIYAFTEPGTTHLQSLLGQLSPETIITFDPNIRPALMGPHPQTVSLFESYCALADVVKLSDEDARWLYPNDDERAVLDRITAFGPRLVALTRGSRGAGLAAGNHRHDEAAVSAQLVDTVGAGDTFMAALLILLASRNDHVLDRVVDLLPSIARFATSMAAITVRRRGADLPLFEEIVELCEKWVQDTTPAATMSPHRLT
ncbi:PfkB family carbohydrate kinase [Arthrobacter psychrolactophilus]|nr:PfkB family carbohydrate kinase [Arthrobacter psychrolactophilus]